MDLALLVGGIGAIGMGLGIETQAAFLLMSIPAGAGLGLTWSYASVVTQAAVPPDKAGGASGVVSRCSSASPAWPSPSRRRR